jgi:hypothetical protein
MFHLCTYVVVYIFGSERFLVLNFLTFVLMLCCYVVLYFVHSSGSSELCCYNRRPFAILYKVIFCFLFMEILLLFTFS